MPNFVTVRSNKNEINYVNLDNVTKASHYVTEVNGKRSEYMNIHFSDREKQSPVYVPPEEIPVVISAIKKFGNSL